MNIGLRMKVVRECCGMAQSDMSKAIGLAPNAGLLSRIEAGKTEPSLSQMQAFCKALEISLEDLVGCCVKFCNVCSTLILSHQIMNEDGEKED